MARAGGVEGGVGGGGGAGAGVKAGAGRGGAVGGLNTVAAGCGRIVPVPRDTPLEDMDGRIPVTYVPARNTIFLSFALGWAEVLNAADIFIGVNALISQFWNAMAGLGIILAGVPAYFYWSRKRLAPGSGA